MARGGINKALVHAARDALLGRGLHPSIDLVRVELGNTGSKSTIQRYLKELNNSQAANLAPLPTLNEKLTTLVSSLAEELTQEAREAVADEQEQLAQQQASFAQAQLRERLEQSLTTITHLTGELEQQRQCERGAARAITRQRGGTPTTATASDRAAVNPRRAGPAAAITGRQTSACPGGARALSTGTTDSARARAAPARRAD